MIFTYPLTWPVGWPRSEYATGGGFKVEFEKAERELAAELERLGASSAYLSTDYELNMSGRPARNKTAKSEAAVLHFVRAGQELTIPCDRFNSLRDNVRAIGLTLEAIRSMERYGTSQMMDAALSGFAALPAGATIVTEDPPRPWHEVLGVSPNASPELIKAAYKVALQKVHPDTGGNEKAFHEVQRAYEEATK